MITLDILASCPISLTVGMLLVEADEVELPDCVRGVIGSVSYAGLSCIETLSSSVWLSISADF
jgi:hypothetical protein